MASCDDDFSLLGDDNSTNSNIQTNPNLRRHYHNRLATAHHQQTTFSHRFTKSPPIHAPVPAIPSLIRHNIPPTVIAQVESPKVLSGDDDDGENEGFSDGAFCSQPDPKCTTTSFHTVNPFSTENNGPITLENECDRSRSRINPSNEKRNDRDELSDGGTPYNNYKRAKLPSVGGSGSGGEYRKDREEWSDTAIACLLDTYMDKFMQLNRGNLRGRDWEEVAAIVSDRCEKISKSVDQCKNKVDNLKKRYKLERQRMSNGGVSASHWPWFKRMEQIVGNMMPSKAVTDEDNKCITGSPSSLRLNKRYATAVSSPSGQTNNIKTKPVTNPRWRRVVFKVSGAALVGSGSQSIDPKVAMLIAREVSMACRVGVEVAVVVGGRNFFCGDTWVTATGLDRCTAYQIGMMATVMNSVLLQSALEKMGVQTRVQTAYSMPEVAEPYNRQRAIRHLEKGRVVIFGGVSAGAGNPLFSTDTAAAHRALELHADAVVKGTNTDGVYDCESGNSNVPFEHISFRDLASRGASAMDYQAVTLCEENGISVVIFNLHEPGNISRALCGEAVGTLVDQTGHIS